MEVLFTPLKWLLWLLVAYFGTIIAVGGLLLAFFVLCALVALFKK